jgi:hypothetical protein
MREYGKVGPTFWTGTTGKEIKRRGSEAVIVALYLMSSPHSNMLGLFYQPVLYMAHETALGIDGAWKGLQGCIEAGFCQFDPETEMVWIIEMASYQIAPTLSPSDNRCKGLRKDYDSLPHCPFLGAFFDRYEHAFHLKNRRTAQDAIPPSIAVTNHGPLQAPPKPGAGAGAGAGINNHPQCRVSTDPQPDTGVSKPTPQGLICRALREAGIQRVNPAHPTLLALIAAGATLDELLGHVPIALGKGDPFSYLLDVAVKTRKRAAEDAAAMKTGPPAHPPDWRDTRQGVIEHAASLGIGPFDTGAERLGTGPTWARYRADVIAADEQQRTTA